MAEEDLKGLGLQLVIDAREELERAQAALEAAICDECGHGGKSARLVALAAGVSHTQVNRILRKHGWVRDA